MVKIVVGIGTARVRLARVGRGLSSSTMVAIAAACLLASLPRASAAAEVLRWKFKPGEVLHYSMDQKIQMNAKGVDLERKSTRSQMIDMSWTVNRVAGDDAEITQRIDRVRVKFESPPYMPFEFDSSDAKAPPAGFEDETKQLKAMVGAEFTFTIKPTGEIGDIAFPEHTLKSFRAAAPRNAPEGDVSEKSLKDMLLQSSPPSFPAEPLEPGKTWKSPPARIPTGFATIVMDRAFTFQGADPQMPNLLLIGMETKVALEPVEGANVTASIRKQEGKGSIRFDAAAGHLASTRLTQRIDMALKDANNQVLEQSTETTTSMALSP